MVGLTAEFSAFAVLPAELRFRPMHRPVVA